MEFRSEALRGQMPKKWAERVSEAGLVNNELFPDQETPGDQDAIHWSRETGTALDVRTGRVFICGTVALDPLEVDDPNA